MRLHDRYLGKRFAGLLLCVAALTLGYFFGTDVKFNALAMALGVLYGAYAAGQSYTDGKKPPGE